MLLGKIMEGGGGFCKLSDHSQDLDLTVPILLTTYRLLTVSVAVCDCRGKLSHPCLASVQCTCRCGTLSL